MCALSALAATSFSPSVSLASLGNSVRFIFLSGSAVAGLPNASFALSTPVSLGALLEALEQRFEAGQHLAAALDVLDGLFSSCWPPATDRSTLSVTRRPFSIFTVATLTDHVGDLRQAGHGSVNDVCDPARARRQCTRTCIYLGLWHESRTICFPLHASLRCCSLARRSRLPPVATPARRPSCACSVCTRAPRESRVRASHQSRAPPDAPDEARVRVRVGAAAPRSPRARCRSAREIPAGAAVVVEVPLDA